MGRFGADVPVWLNSLWAEADLRITTGFVEPHFFAGFSGGPKLVAPGLAGLETTLVLHDAARIGHADARWGVTHGNPVHDDVRAIAAGTGTHFSLDVVLDGAHRVAAAFGGELLAMHEAACVVVRQTAMRPVARPFDVVVTTNSGFPLDQNLYQAVKGMSAAARWCGPAERSSAPPSAATASLAMAPIARNWRRRTRRPRCWRRSGQREDRARPVAGADPGWHPGPLARDPAHLLPLR